MTENGSPPRGFAKGVNEYFNHFVNLADAKAGGVLTLAVAVGAVLANLDPDGCRLQTARWAGFVAFAIAIGAAVFALFPRLPSTRRGLIFWEDVRGYGSPQAYVDALSALNDADVDRAYAEQNFYVSRVLHRKYRSLQVAFVFLVAGLALTGVTGIFD
jgi:hypothetical protein